MLGMVTNLDRKLAPNGTGNGILGKVGQAPRRLIASGFNPVQFQADFVPVWTSSSAAISLYLKAANVFLADQRTGRGNDKVNTEFSGYRGQLPARSMGENEHENYDSSVRNDHRGGGSGHCWRLRLRR